MSHKLLTLSFLVTGALPFLVPTTSMAQEPPPPGYGAPPPGYYAPQPYPQQGYAPQAYAAPPPVPGFHEHDGFYLRVLLGLGYLHNSASYQGASYTLSGPGATFGLALGGVVAPNLVVYGEVISTAVSDPHFDDGTSSGTYSGETVSLTSIGPGVAYYLDGNMYLSGTLLFSKISYSDSNDSSNSVDGTDLGVGLGLTLGKEWWVSHDWGLGIAGQLSASSMKDASYDMRWTGVTASLLFSATYN